MKRRTLRYGLTLLIAIAIFFSFFYSLPYYISKPGMAKELEPIIEIADGYDAEGSFMLTTVRMGRANLFSYIGALISDYQEVYPLESIRSEEESDEEYNVRQLYLMTSSKLSAVEVAYKRAGIPIDYEYRGVYILSVMENMPAEGRLLPGDRIFAVDGNEFKSSEEFMEYVSGKKEGDKITLTFERHDKVSKTSVEVQTFPDNEEKLGIGIGLVDDKEIKATPAIEINTEDIGGPSAGLMFSLEIYNQLTETDLTKGYKIAGTGTISPDGKVGRIGGIQQKIVAADHSGAEIFFAPSEKIGGESNYEEAVKTAKDIGTDMKIVPVETFEEAVRYLENVKSKQ